MKFDRNTSSLQNNFSGPNVTFKTIEAITKVITEKANISLAFENIPSFLKNSIRIRNSSNVYTL
jgi:hypothetical protein